MQMQNSIYSNGSLSRSSLGDITQHLGLKLRTFSFFDVPNIMKLVCNIGEFDRPVQVYLHEQKLPQDSDKDTYYLTSKIKS